MNKKALNHSRAIRRIFTAAIVCAFMLMVAGQVYAQKAGGFTGPKGESTAPAQVPAVGPGGFSGPGPDLTTVAQALEMRDDARVALKGHIIKSLGGDKYLFQDSTGSIEVEIDHKYWQGQTVTPEDTVVLQGKVDKDWSYRSIDVKRLIKQ